MMTAEIERLRAEILTMARRFQEQGHPPRPFIPGRTYVPVSGKVLGPDELENLVDASLDLWLTSGRYSRQFEQGLAKVVGVNFAAFVNSGSSANLLAVSALTSESLGDRAIRPGDEVITVAAGFPTTVNPILQVGAVPVFVDITVPEYNIDIQALEAALTDRTRAIVLAHTLGNPFNVDFVVDFARRNNLWLIEDCCDALGSTWRGVPVGSFGDLSTLSFYPAHHITTGEGGAVLTKDRDLSRIVESFRDWGRDCWCDPGRDNTCGKRFDFQLGELPAGFDHKYTYTHIGYNLKATDMQAAVGLAQLRQLPEFSRKRRDNFNSLRTGLSSLIEFLELPTALPESDPSWFGFPVAVRSGGPMTRVELVTRLEKRRIGTRLLFGGNLTRQPAYIGKRYRTVGELPSTDRVMNDVFWIGVYPGLPVGAIDYVLEVFHDLYT